MIKDVINWKVIISISSIAMIFSCGNSMSSELQNETQNQKETVTDEIKGEYYFKFPSGEVELVTVNLDHTYLKAIYKNENDYQNNAQVLYENKGSWIMNEGKIEFNDWLSYCYIGLPDSILNKPEDYSYMPATWFPSTDEHKAILDIYSENGYVFTKLE